MGGEDMAKEISIMELANKLGGTIVGSFDDRVKLVGTCAVVPPEVAETSITRMTSARWVQSGNTSGRILCCVLKKSSLKVTPGSSG